MPQRTYCIVKIPLSKKMRTFTLKEEDIKKSMDGKRRAIEKKWIECFWRTLKYICIYLNPPKNGIELY
ncbi:hypothetical protein [Salinimicrobium sp. GXAS 041]|uniref:hypothetical protein n=1 Tax=Salinimicrobium sp. GXAS 041 TaxID=3400806 RepID=UPI003C752B13